MPANDFIKTLCYNDNMKIWNVNSWYNVTK